MRLSRLLQRPRNALAASTPRIQRLGGGGRRRGTEAIASRGRARPADFEPLALRTRRGHFPPRAPSCPGEPNCVTPTLTAPRCPWQPPFPKSPEESPGPNPQPLPRVQAPKAGRRGAPPNTEQLPSQTPAGSEAPSGPGGLFGERRKSEHETPKRRMSAFSPWGLWHTAQGLD